MLRSSERAEKPPENQLKAVLRVLWREGRDRRLRSDNELELGDQVDDELTVRAQRVANAVPPAADLGLCLAQDLADEVLECLRQRGIGDVALVLVELAGREQAARRDEHLVQFVRHRG